MSVQDRRQLMAAQRNHLHLFVRKAFEIVNPGVPFVPNWHVDAMCHKLDQVYQGEIKRLIITVPPRSLKSICTSVALVAWWLGHEPNTEFLVASYSQELASKHARDFRTLAEDPRYKSIFPGMRIDPRKNTEAEMLTFAHGGRKAISLGGAATGFGANVLIVDDLMKASDMHSPTERDRCLRFYEETLFTRLNNPSTDRIIVIQQRLHEADLVGHLLEKGGFEHLNLPATAIRDEEFELPLGKSHHRRRDDLLFPQRLSREALDDCRRNIGPMAFSAQYQQDPTPPGGNHVQWDWFPTYDPAITRDDCEYVAQSWDTAIAIGQHNDYSVCITFGHHNNRWLILDVYRSRLEYPGLREAVGMQKRRWNAAAIVVEDSGVGSALLRERLEGVSQAMWGRRAHLAKEVRFIAQTGKISDGLVCVPPDAPWLAPFRKEILGFPNVRHDDQADALSQFLDWADPRRIELEINRSQNGGRLSGAVRPQGRPRDQRGPSSGRRMSF